MGRCVGDKSASWFSPLHGQGATGNRYNQGEQALPEVDTNNDHKFFDPTLFIYDAFPGGVGFAEKLFNEHERLLDDAYQMINCCPCAKGCPSCIGALPAMNDRTKAIPLMILEELSVEIGAQQTLQIAPIVESPIPTALFEDHKTTVFPERDKEGTP